MVKQNGNLDRVFGALADPTRRAILHRLRGRGTSTVTELAGLFPVSLPAVSRHLKVLERAGLVRRRVDGRIHRLALKTGPFERVADWVSHYRDFWTARLEALEREMVDRRQIDSAKRKEKRS